VGRQDVYAVQRDAVAAGAGGGRVQLCCDGRGRGGGGLGAGDGAHQRGGAAGGVALQRVPGACAARGGPPMRLRSPPLVPSRSRAIAHPARPPPFPPGRPGGSQGRARSGSWGG
jgi:hypothetical protein